MSKATWQKKAMYIIFALTLVGGLCAVTIPKQPVASAVLPMFYANRTLVAVGETVYFTNLTMQEVVVTPYTKAEWDFNNDGVYEITLTGVEHNVMKDVTWVYDKPGVYSVRLQMTDSAPTTRCYIREDYITVHNTIELNPYFQADRTVVDVGELVTFINMTAAGKHPYTKAEWDFNNDGVFEITKTGTEAEVMGSLNWAYDEPGNYTVRLQMTDSTPISKYKIRYDYITIIGATLPPCRFYGSVQVDESNVPNGTAITATIEGDSYTTTTLSLTGASTYRIDISQPQGQDYEGGIVQFKIGNFTADQTGTWHADDNVELDLTASTTQPTVETWDLPHGLDEDPMAINMYLYPSDAAQVALADIAAPEELVVVWYYGGPEVGWQWFEPGWPESTLTSLVPGEYYIGIVSAATQWEIPQ